MVVFVGVAVARAQIVPQISTLVDMMIVRECSWQKKGHFWKRIMWRMLCYFGQIFCYSREINFNARNPKSSRLWLFRNARIPCHNSIAVHSPEKPIVYTLVCKPEVCVPKRLGVCYVFRVPHFVVCPVACSFSFLACCFFFLIFASSSAESKHAINRRPNKKATQTAWAGSALLLLLLPLLHLVAPLSRPQIA